MSGAQGSTGGGASQSPGGGSSHLASLLPRPSEDDLTPAQAWLPCVSSTPGAARTGGPGVLHGVLSARTEPTLRACEASPSPLPAGGPATFAGKPRCRQRGGAPAPAPSLQSPALTVTQPSCSPWVSACLPSALLSSSCQRSRPQAGMEAPPGSLPTPHFYSPSPSTTSQPFRCHFCQAFGRGCPGNPKRQWKSYSPPHTPPYHSPVNPG